MAWARNSVVVGVLIFGACRTYDVTYTDDAGSSCDSGPLTICNGACVDVSTDRSNCGSCGTQCTASELCSAGLCSPCPAGDIACGQTGAVFCTNVLTDTAHCGDCTTACDHGSTCTNGKCSCPLTTCGTDCIDTQNDVLHCGGCDSPCTPSAPNETPICSKGQCSSQCVSPFADCDGVGSNGCEANLQTDVSNCGACMRACVSGTCAAGSCPIVTYVTGANLAGLAVDSSYVYYVDQSNTGGIEKIPLIGGSPVVVYADNQATALALDSGRIVWLHVNSLIESQLLTGGSVATLATLSSVQTLTAAAGYAYFTTSNGVGRVISDGTSAFVNITSASDPQATAVDTTNIYFADNAGNVLFAAITALNVNASLVGVFGAVALTADATTLYWMNSNGDVMSRTKLNTQQPVKLASGETITSNLVTDGNALYWGANDGSIHRLSVLGGASKKLASGQGSVRTIAVDATQVYWTSPSLVATTTK